MKKMSALFLAVLLVAMTACSAFPDTPQTNTGSANETVSTEAEEPYVPSPVISALQSLYIGGNNVLRYSIVYSKNADDTTVSLAKKLQSFLHTATGKKPEIVLDYTLPAEDAFEIVLGRTNRSKSLALAEEDDDYWFTLEGNRLLIGSKTALGLAAACERFIRGEAGTWDGSVYTVSDSLVFRSEGRTEPMLSYVCAHALDYRKAAGVEVIVKTLDGIKSDTKTDVYGGFSFAALCLPKGSLTSSQLAKANLIVRNTMQYPVADGGMKSILAEEQKDAAIGHPFTAIRLVRLLYSDQSLLEEETKEMMKDYFLTANFCSRYDSENLILMFRVARYLAACYYEGETFVQYGMTAEEAKKEDYDAIVAYLQHHASNGWAEFDSTHYNIEDFFFMLNLYDLATDETIRKLAAMTMDVFLLDALGDSTQNNVSGGAHGRIYADAAYDMEEGMSYLLSLYFGKEDSASLTDGAVLHSAPFAFLSDYCPDSVVYEIIEEKEYPFSNYERIYLKSYSYYNYLESEDCGSISKYTYNTDSYSIGCINTEDYYPAGQANYRYFQQTNWSLVFAADSTATVFTSHPGCAFNDAVLGNKSGHDFWFGDMSCNCQEFFGYENIVMGVYNIDISKQKYTYIHARIKESAFDEVIWATDENAVYLCLGDAYAVLRFTEKYEVGTGVENEVKIRRIGSGNTRIGFVCEAGDAASYGTFEAFVAAMREKTLVFDKENLSLTYGNMTLAAGKNAKTWNRILSGTTQVYPYENLYDSPFMTSAFGSGVIVMKSSRHVRTMDFYAITDKTEKTE